MTDLRITTTNGAEAILEDAVVQELRAGLARSAALSWRCRLRRGPQDLERDDRPTPCTHCSLRWRSRCARGGQIRPHPRGVGVGPWRRPQRSGQCRVPGRPDDRSRRHAKRPRRSDPAHSPCRGWSHLGRFRSRDPGVRSGHDRRLGLRYRYRRPHTGWWPWLARAASTASPATTSSPSISLPLKASS